MKAGAPAAAKRMPKEDRRRQLMAAALDIVREEGVEALTLARVAERAGVTKPIAYDHFETRAGLMIALFKDHDDHTSAAVAAALAKGPRSIEEVAGILSRAYIECCVAMGPEILAVFEALSTSEETAAFLQSWRDDLAAQFRAAFGPFLDPRRAKRGDEAVFVGMLGAAEAMSQAVLARRLTRPAAIEALTHILAGAVAPLRKR